MNEWGESKERERVRRERVKKEWRKKTMGDKGERQNRGEKEETKAPSA